MPGDPLDLDNVFERVLVDIGGRQVLLTVGKDGLLWKLDRRSGAGRRPWIASRFCSTAS